MLKRLLSTNVSMAERGSIMCISDVHGNLDLLRTAIRRGLALSGRQHAPADVVLLGDCCDNGPQVPELLEWLATETWRQEFPLISLNNILGNHDLACLLSANPAAFNADPAHRPRGYDWYTRWSKYFANPGGSTVAQYGASTQLEFMSQFPPHHYQYLASLPWCVEMDQYIFVHAGLRAAKEESVESQLAFLSRKDMSDLSRHVYQGGGYGLPDQLCNKQWSRTNDPEWGAVVVTGHNKYGKDDSADFEASHRIGFHSCACAIAQNPDLSLHCALLPRGPRGSTVHEYPPLFFRVRLADAMSEIAGETESV